MLLKFSVTWAEPYTIPKMRPWPENSWHITLDWSRPGLTSNWIPTNATYLRLSMQLGSGWWFGTWLLFFHSVGNVIIPTDELIFFRGVSSNHQPVKWIVKVTEAVGCQCRLQMDFPWISQRSRFFLAFPGGEDCANPSMRTSKWSVPWRRENEQPGFDGDIIFFFLLYWLYLSFLFCFTFCFIMFYQIYWCDHLFLVRTLKPSFRIEVVPISQGSQHLSRVKVSTTTTGLTKP